MITWIWSIVSAFMLLHLIAQPANASLVGDDVTIGIFVQSGVGTIVVGPTATVGAGSEFVVTQTLGPSLLVTHTIDVSANRLDIVTTSTGTGGGSSSIRLYLTSLDAGGAITGFQKTAGLNQVLNPSFTANSITFDLGFYTSEADPRTTSLLIEGVVAELPGGFAYVTNTSSNSVSVIDTATNTVGATVAVGGAPLGLALTPDGAFAYVANRSSSTVSVIDAASSTVIATIGVGSTPVNVAFTPDGSKAYVTNYGSGTVSVIDTVTKTVTATVSVGSAPDSLQVSPNGQRLYVANQGSGNISIVDTATNAVIRTIPTGNRPTGVVLSPNGAYAYVANFGSDSVSIVDTATSAVVSTIAVGNRPEYLSISVAGAFVYVPNFGSNTVSVISTTSRTVVATIAVGNGPWGTAITPDGSRLYVVNFYSNSVSVIDTATNAITATVMVGSSPIDVAITPGDGPSPPVPDLTPPVAIAGPDQSVRVGDTVFLNGSASYDDNTDSAALTYRWLFAWLPPGSSAALVNVDTATPYFVVDVAGTYSVLLVVSDAFTNVSNPDFVEISSDNLPPTAAAGSDQLVVVGTTVTLDGSGSTDPESDPLSYSWSLGAAPAGSAATLSGVNSVTPSFTPDLEGEYQVTLVVRDALGPGAPDSVTVTATNAGEYAEIQIVEANAIVSNLTLDEVTTVGNQSALTNFLSQATMAFQKGNTAQVIAKLQQAIERTDGCVLRGAPDTNGPGRDWITDCAAQTIAYSELKSALNALTQP